LNFDDLTGLDNIKQWFFKERKKKKGGEGKQMKEGMTLRLGTRPRYCRQAVVGRLCKRRIKEGTG
jgi:hypothetical protein